MTSADDEQARYRDARELLSASFEIHDANGLMGASPDERAAQREARAALYSYVTELYQQAKRQGLHPAQGPGFAAVGAMRDLAVVLYDTAIHAQVAMHDSERRSEDADTVEPAKTEPTVVETAHPDPYHPWLDRPVTEWWRSSRFTGDERADINDRLDDILKASVEQLASEFLAQEPPDSYSTKMWALFELAAVTTGRLRFYISIARTEGMTWSEIAAWVNVPDASAAWRLAAAPLNGQLVASWSCNHCQMTLFELDPGPDNNTNYFAGHGHAANCPRDAVSP